MTDLEKLADYAREMAGAVSPLDAYESELWAHIATEIDTYLGPPADKHPGLFEEPTS